MKNLHHISISNVRLFAAVLLVTCASLAPQSLHAAGSDSLNRSAQAQEKTIRLQNQIVSFEFSQHDGSLSQITDLKRGYQWLSPSTPRRLVKLIQRTPEKSSNILLSNDAGPPEFKLTGDTLTIRFPALRDGVLDTGILLTVTVRLPEDSPEAFFAAEIENRGAYPIVEAWFPFIAGRSGPKDGGEDVFTTSHGFEHALYAKFDHGTLDTHAFGQHLQRIGVTSGQLLPMMDLSTPRGGLSYIKYEKKPRPTDFVYENLSGNSSHAELGWAWVTTLLLQPGKSYRSCEFGIGVHQSDWHTTADRLRKFMEPWWRPTDMPRSLREKIGLYHVQIKGFNGEPYHDFDELPAMARDCLKYGVTDISFWDYTASVYCRPDTGDFWEMPHERKQKLKSALREVKGMGFQISACVNYRLINETSKAWQRIGSEAQYSFFGIPLYGNASGSMNGAIYINRYYDQGARSLSQCTEKFRTFARELTQQTIDLGLNSLFIDQAFESSYALPKDQESLDPFAAMDRAYSWFGEETKFARQRDSEAYSIGEVPDLWNTQSVDAWWVWAWNSPAWPPLEVFKYVMPEACFVWCTDEYQRPVLSKAFAMGSFLAIATRGMTGLLSDAPEYAAQIGRLAKLRKETAPFVSHGRFVDKRGLIVTGGEGYVYLSEGGLAVTLANGKPDAVEVTVRLLPGKLSDKRLETGHVHFENGIVAAADPAKKGEEWELSLKLDGYSAAIWTIPLTK